MYHFGKTSTKRLLTCHEDIQTILKEVIKIYDVSVLEGLRSTERQQHLFKQGKSKLDGINILSKHQGKLDKKGNKVSFAVDIIPYKKGHNAFSGKIKDGDRFYFMMGIVRGISERLFNEGKITHKVRFGLDWDSDDILDDQNFDDLPHMELI